MYVLIFQASFCHILTYSNTCCLTSQPSHLVWCGVCVPRPERSCGWPWERLLLCWCQFLMWWCAWTVRLTSASRWDDTTATPVARSDTQTCANWFGLIVISPYPSFVSLYWMPGFRLLTCTASTYTKENCHLSSKTSIQFSHSVHVFSLIPMKYWIKEFICAVR